MQLTTTSTAESNVELEKPDTGSKSDMTTREVKYKNTTQASMVVVDLSSGGGFWLRLLIN